MKKFWTIFKKDMKLSYQGIYFYMEIGMALVFVLIMLLFVPENFNPSQTLYATVEMDTPLMDNLPTSTFDYEGYEIQLFESRTDLENALNQNRNAIGLHLKMIDNRPHVDFVMQGHESEMMKNFIKLSIESEISAQMPQSSNRTSIRRLEDHTEKLSDRAHLLPMYLVINVAFMGLFIIASYVFLDKEEGVIKAFSVAPVSIWQYLLSKIAIMAVMSLLVTLLVTLAIVGTDFHFPLLILATLIFNIFGSTLGLLITSYFENMNKAFGALFLSIYLLMFGSVAYFIPGFSPVWIRILPSYAMVFSFREILLTSGNYTFVVTHLILFSLLNFILFGFTQWRFKKSLTL